MGNIIRSLAIGICICACGWTAQASEDSFWFQVEPGSAGQPAQVVVSGLTEGETVGFTLTRPDDSQVRFSDTTDAQGRIVTEVFGLHVQTAGSYSLQAIRALQPSDPVVRSFVIGAGEVSAHQSGVAIDPGAAPADGRTRVQVVVWVSDAYANPVAGEEVQIVSSRNDDTVVLLSGQTDEEGIARGYVTSDVPGVSVLTVLVGDSVVYEKPEIVFHLPAGLPANVGQSGDSGIRDFLKGQIFDDEDFGEASFLVFEDLPSEMIVGQNYSFQVRAKDEDGKTVKDYSGKIRFGTSDNQARIPADYTFTPEDQGVHTFALALSFASPGRHTFQVNDVSNFRISGQATVNVLPDGEGGSTPGEGTQSISILTPTSGTYNTSTVTITGKSTGVQKLRISDGPTVLVEGLAPDASGNFVYNTPKLQEGLHKFLVTDVEGTVRSNEVAIRVDRTAPTAMNITIDPSGAIERGAQFQIRVASQEPLSGARCSINGVTANLQPAGDFFVVTMKAPQQCGTFPVACTVSDLLGNERSEPNAGAVKICGADPGLDTDGDGVPDVDEPGDDDEDGVENKYESNKIDSTGNGVVDQLDPTNDTDEGGHNNTKEKENGTDPLDPSDDKTAVEPLAVTNLTAEPGEKKITLFWSPAQDDGGIATYRVEYGMGDANEFPNVQETPDNRTQWYIDGLEEATKYTFRIVAIDLDGNEGPPSRAVSSTTLGEPLHGTAPLIQAGAKTWIAGFLSVLVGFGMMLMFRRSGAS